MVTPAASGRPALTEFLKIAMVSTPVSVAAPKSADAPHETALLFPLASMTDVTVEPSGILCRKTARKTIQPNQLETRNADAMAMPSKKVWMISPRSTDQLR